MIGSTRITAALSSFLIIARVREGSALSAHAEPTTTRRGYCLGMPRSAALAWLGGALTSSLPFVSLDPSRSRRGDSPAPAAWAVQERNEALCRTGFFTNIMQYRCTDLGDISDEGEARSLSESQAEAADGLLSKLGLSGQAERPPTVADGDESSGSSLRSDRTQEKIGDTM
jgi:hypothetical protein